MNKLRIIALVVWMGLQFHNNSNAQARRDTAPKFPVDTIFPKRPANKNAPGRIPTDTMYRGPGKNQILHEKKPPQDTIYKSPKDKLRVKPDTSGEHPPKLNEE